MNQKDKRKRILGWVSSLTVLVLISFIAVANVPSALAADNEWQAKYWNNKRLSGDPVLVRQESNIDHDWSDGTPPGVNGENFSARWKRTINRAAGTYRFTATMDDGMRVWMDDSLIIDSWYDSQVHTVTADVYLSGGDHVVKVEYYNAVGDAIAKMKIETISVSGGGNWRGEYFNNTSLSGTPALVRDDEKIDFNWGGGAPASSVAADNFSVRWTRTINLEQGRYRFTSTTDDGVRLWVAGRLLIDKWFDQSATTYSAEMDLPGGLIEIRMEYYDRAGGALARLDRVKVSGTTGGDGNWRGEYYSNKNLSGSPTLVRNDASISFNWGNGSPDPAIGADKFSVRWTRSLSLSPGRYRFVAETDDGVRLWVNGQQIIDAWYDHQPQQFAGEISLPGGTVEVRMEYFEDVGGAMANLSRTLVNANPPVTPPVAPISAATATVSSLRLNFRQGPGLGYPVTQVLNQRDMVYLLARDQLAAWVQVQAPNGAQGWVYGSLLQSSYPMSSLPLAAGLPPVPVNTVPTATVSYAIYALNVRSGPGFGFAPITAVIQGQRVNLLGRNAAGNWIKVQLSDGRQGWSSATYLVSSTGFANLPVTN